MKIYKDGIYKTINSDEFGIYQKAGFVKVIENKETKEQTTKKEDLVVDEELVIAKPKPKKKN